MSARRDVVGSAALHADGLGPDRTAARWTLAVQIAGRIADAASGALGDFAAAALSILAALDRRFAVAGLLAAPLQAHTLRWYLRTSQPLYAAGRTAEGRRASAPLGAFTALRALRLGPGRYARAKEASAAAMSYEFRATRAATRFYGRLNIAEFTGLSTVLLVAWALVHSGHADVGTATTAALFFVGLFDPVSTLRRRRHPGCAGVRRAPGGLARPTGGGDRRAWCPPPVRGQPRCPARHRPRHPPRAAAALAVTWRSPSTGPPWR